MSEQTPEYWFNLTTRQVERGPLSHAVDRAGPFATAEEAARAPEILAARSQAWADDDAREDDWGAAPTDDAPRQ